MVTRDSTVEYSTASWFVIVVNTIVSSVDGIAYSFLIVTH